MQDLDIDFQLVLNAATYDQLMEQLGRDTALLESLRVMDYSLLLGVHYLSWGPDQWEPPRIKVFVNNLHMPESHPSFVHVHPCSPRITPFVVMAGLWHVQMAFDSCSWSSQRLKLSRLHCTDPKMPLCVVDTFNIWPGGACVHQARLPCLQLAKLAQMYNIGIWRQIPCSFCL